MKFVDGSCLWISKAVRIAYGAHTYNVWDRKDRKEEEKNWAFSLKNAPKAKREPVSY